MVHPLPTEPKKLSHDPIYKTVTRTMMKTPLIYAGIHQPAMAGKVPRAMLSVNRLLDRKSNFKAQDWILDSGAFSRIIRQQGHLPIDQYASQVRRWSSCGNLQAAVAQDYMCEPEILLLTGMTVAEHQALTTENFLKLRELAQDVHVMPVIQGYEPEEYAKHTRELSPHLEEYAWVGVGSVCRRQGRPAQVAQVISAILGVRPDLRLHGFGVKTTALADASVALRLYSVDSMAWSYAARRRRFREEPGSRNSLETCLEWLSRVESIIPRAAQAPLGM